MIEVVRGDVLNVPIGIIVHGCNCRGVMGGGIALSIKQRYPYAYEIYKQAEIDNGLELGFMSYAEVEPNKFIVNAYTQDDFGTDKRQVNYEALATIFEKVAGLAADIQYDREMPEPLPICFPKIGAGLAGGNWKIIEMIIDESIPPMFKRYLYLFP